MRLTLVYPNGQRGTLDGGLPPIGSDMDGYRIDFIKHSNEEEATIYLGLHYGQVAVVKLIYIVASGSRYPITVAEAAELADRLRRRGGEQVGSALNAVAVRLEQLVDESPDTPEMSFLVAEVPAFQLAILDWIVERGEDSVPQRVMALHDALRTSSG